MIILIIFITLITILIASYINVPWIFILLIIFFYILIYVLLSREKDSAKRFVVKINNQENKQNFFFSDKDKSIFNQNTFPMIIVDKSYRITSSNVAFNSYVGKDANGMNLSLCLRSNELNDALSDALTNEKKSDINFIIYDQVHKYIQAQIFPLKIKKEIFALVMMIDETPQKIAEKLKSEFVSNVSHELKTPLTAIMGFIETINGPAKNDEKQKSKFLSIIKTEAERMQRLVNDTLALIRVEETEYQIPNEKVDIYRCASSAIDAAKQTADKKNIQIKLSSSYSQNELFIRGNDDQIIEIFENLISNALTYSQESTTININFEVGSSEICLIVEDQGCGIPKQDILKVTERFYRSKNAAQFKKSSSGLGLSIVKHIVNRHAGRLVIESEENTGSIFKVFLPVYIEK